MNSLLRDNRKRYAEAEFEFLYQELSRDFNTDVVNSMKHAVRNLFNPYEKKEGCIHSKSLSDKECKELREYEPYGEAKVFVLFGDFHGLRFNFWDRHLRRFLFDTPLLEMPLFVNQYFISTLAVWRLKIAR